MFLFIYMGVIDEEKVIRGEAMMVANDENSFSYRHYVGQNILSCSLYHAR